MISCKQILSAFLGVLAALLLPCSALAAEGTVQDASLTLAYHDNGTPITGAHIDLYQVAQMDEAGNLTIAPAFQDYNVKIDPSDDDSWKTLAVTLEGLVLRDGLEALRGGETDAQGQLVFSGLERGLYLALGRSHTQGDRIYECRPIVVALPRYDSETGRWIYHVEAGLKFTSRTTQTDLETVERKVLKRWADSGHENERPQEVAFLLLRDGAVYDRVTLNAGNNWRFTWTELDRDAQWTIVEESGAYTVSMFREGVTFVATNTYPEEPPPDTPEEPPPPPEDDIPDDEIPLVPSEKEPPKTPEEDIPDEDIPLTRLPQTGQLWWPVPALLSAGLLLSALGLLYIREDS